MSLTQVFLIFLASLLFALLGTPLAKRVAVLTGVLDVPSGRKIHHAPIPLLGGTAIYAGVVLALLVFGHEVYVRELVALMLGATVVALLGVVDDARGLRPLIKLGGQITAALALIWSSQGKLQITIFSPNIINIVLTVFWIVAITNAFNLLDNMDGLSGGLAAVAASYFLLLAALNDQILVSGLAAALLGACVGFLRYNFHRASIFMGDAGSLFLGFILAGLAVKLRFLSNTTLVTWMIPPIVLGVPIFDTTLVSISRLRRGLNPLTNAGKDHLSHRLALLGLSRRETVLVCYLVGSALGMIAVFLTRATVAEAYVMLALLLLLGGYAVVKLEQLYHASQQTQ